MLKEQMRTRHKLYNIQQVPKGSLDLLSNEICRHLYKEEEEDLWSMSIIIQHFHSVRCLLAFANSEGSVLPDKKNS